LQGRNNVRRATLGSALNKMLAAISKHKWAYPFKRPVTEKEAPDYKDFVSNPMDFTTLKRRVESGAVASVPALVHDLNLIFENAMLYNARGSDYYKMAVTLRETTRVQLTLYEKWALERGVRGHSAAPSNENPDDRMDACAKDDACDTDTECFLRQQDGHGELDRSSAKVELKAEPVREGRKRGSGSSVQTNASVMAPCLAGLRKRARRRSSNTDARN
jgi:hypothetical protein